MTQKEKEEEERLKEYHKVYYELNRESLKRYNHYYHKKNSEKISIRKKQYYLDKKEQKEKERLAHEQML